MDRICPKCITNIIQYSNKYSYENAIKKGTMCPSCRTSKNNKSINRNVAKSKNPSWKGFNEIPGKVFSKLKLGAIQRDLSFDITIEDIWNQYYKQEKVCAYTGINLVWGLDASIDRIDSNLGYTIDNIQIVHKAINMLKRDMPHEAFISWCTLVADNF